MAPEEPQRSWINAEANHGGSCHPIAPEVAQRSWINEEDRAEASHAHINKLERSNWGYQLMSCYRLRCIFNGCSLETVPSSLSSTQKEKVE